MSSKFGSRTHIVCVFTAAGWRVFDVYQAYRRSLITYWLQPVDRFVISLSLSVVMQNMILILGMPLLMCE